jgi:hypothetical protein
MFDGKCKYVFSCCIYLYIDSFDTS